MTITEPNDVADRDDPATAALAVQNLELAYVVRGVPARCCGA